MTNTVNMNYKDILNKITLVYLDVGTYSGLVKNDENEESDIRTPGSFRLIDKKHTRALNANYVAAKRACSQRGFKCMGGYGMPTEKVDELKDILNVLGTNFYKQKDFLVQNIDTLNEEWADLHPEDAAEIRSKKPDAAYIERQVKFRPEIFNVSPPETEVVFDFGREVQSDKNRVLSLADKLIEEVVQDVKSNFSNTGKGNARSLGFLTRVLAKIESLSFIDPRVVKIGKLIRQTMKKLPVSGSLEGESYLVFAGLMAILSDEKRLMNETLKMDIQETPSGVVVEVTTPVAPVAEWVDVTTETAVAIKADVISEEAKTVIEQMIDNGNTVTQAEIDAVIEAEPVVTIVVDKEYSQESFDTSEVETIAEQSVTAPELVKEENFEWAW